MRIIIYNQTQFFYAYTFTFYLNILNTPKQSLHSIDQKSNWIMEILFAYHVCKEKKKKKKNTENNSCRIQFTNTKANQIQKNCILDLYLLQKDRDEMNEQKKIKRRKFSIVFIYICIERIFFLYFIFFLFILNDAKGTKNSKEKNSRIKEMNEIKKRKNEGQKS